MSIPGSANPLLLASAAEAAGYNIERSLRFNSADSAYLSRTPASAGNRKTWTWAGWVKRSAGFYVPLLFARDPSLSGWQYFFLATINADKILIETGSHVVIYTEALYRDFSAWMHVVFAVDATQATATNRLKLYVNGLEVTSFSIDGRSNITQNVDGYINSTNAHRIGSSYSDTRFADGYLADVHFIDGQALDPTSFTEVSATTGRLEPKQYAGSFGTNGFWLKFSDNSAATATTLGKDYSGNGNNWTPNNFIASNAYAVLPTPSVAPTDPSGAWDGNPSTYAYGPSATTWTFSTPISLPAARFDLHARSGWTWTASTNLGTVTLTSNGAWPGSPGSYPGWYSYANAGLTTVYSISVSAHANWSLQGMQIAGNPSVVGTQLLAFGSQNSSDSLVDTPTSYGTDTGAGGEVRGNYCTLNPIDRLTTATLSNGNLEFTTATTGHNAIGTIGMVSGKWYWEASTTAGTTQARATVYGASASSYYSFAANNTVYGFRFDADSGVLEYTTNGSSWTSLATGLTSGPYFPYFNNNGTTSKTIIANFGQRPFAYTAPSGFKALCDTNLPAPVVAKPSTVMDVKLYTGNGSTQTISGLGFSPDFVWIKQRSGAQYHTLQDTVRGATQDLYSNATDAESTYAQSLNAFNSDGFTVGSVNWVNQNSQTYVAWTWDAGSSTVTNTQGSITSQVRANASAGFSIVTYTGNGTAGATIGHGLGVAPQFVIVKNRSNATNWMVGHHFLDATTPWNYYMRLNGTIARAAAADFWNNTAPSGTVITLGTSTSVNSVDGDSYVAYCFAPVAGYSSGFSYTGNGSTDGSFVYLGFRPRLILLKCSSTTGNWTLLDTAREGYNVDNDPLYPNLSDAEGTTDLLDITSNGFKLRTTDASVNSSGATYVGYAWAEAPFAYSRAR